MRREHWEHQQAEVAHWLVSEYQNIDIMTRSNETNTRIESAAGSTNSTRDVHEQVIYHRPTTRRKNYGNFSPLSLFPIRYVEARRSCTNSFALELLAAIIKLAFVMSSREFHLSEVLTL